MMALNSVLDDMAACELERAIALAQVSLQQKDSKTAFSLLQTLAFHISPKFEEIDVYRLSELCCRCICLTKTTSQLKYLQALHKIVSHLIEVNQEMAMNLLKLGIIRIEGTKSQSAALVNNLIDLVISKIEESKRKVIQIALHVLKELFASVHHQKIHRIIILAVKLEMKRDSVESLVTWLQSIPNLMLTGRETTAINHFIACQIQKTPDIQCVKTIARCLRRCFQSFQVIHPDVGLVLVTLEFCVEPNSHFLNLHQMVKSRASTDRKASQYASYILYKFSNNFLSNDQFVSNKSTQFMDLCAEMFSSLANPWELDVMVKLINTSLSVAYSIKSPEILTKIYPTVKRLIEDFLIAANLSSLNFESPVSSVLPIYAFVKNIAAYGAAQCHSEVLNLTVVVLHHFMRVDPKQLSKDHRMNNYLTHLVNSSVNASPRETDVGRLFVQFSSAHPQFAHILFDGWARLNDRKVNDFGLRQPNKTVETKLKRTAAEVIESEDADVGLLLFFEIRAYSKLPGFDCDHIIKTYQKALLWVKDDLKRAALLNATLDALRNQEIGSNHINLRITLNELSIKLSQQLKEEKSKEKLSRILCSLGNLAYLKLRLILFDKRKSSCHEVDSFADINKNISVTRGDQPDELDRTAVSPAHGYLDTNFQTTVIETAVKALKFWESAKKNLVLSDFLSCTMSYIKGLGYILRLHKLKSHEIRTWRLLYELATTLKLPKYEIIGVAELLITVKEVDSSLIERMNCTLKNQKDFKDHDFVSQLFYVNLAKYHVVNGRVNECKEVLKKTVASLNSKSLFLVGAQKVIVDWLIANDNGAKEAKISSLVTFVQKFENLYSWYLNYKWTSFNQMTVCQNLFLDAALLLGLTYGDSFNPRLTRKYLNPTVAIAQKLMLPIRVYEFLSILGQIDAIGRLTEDCEHKLYIFAKGLQLKSLTEADVQRFSPDSKLQLKSALIVPHIIRGKCSCEFCSNTEYVAQALNALTLKGFHLDPFQNQSFIEIVIKCGEEVIGHLMDVHLLESLLPNAVVKFYLMAGTCKILWNQFSSALTHLRKAMDWAQHSQNSAMLQMHIECLLGRIAFIRNSSSTKLSNLKTRTHLRKRVRSATDELALLRTPLRSDEAKILDIEKLKESKVSPGKRPRVSRKNLFGTPKPTCDTSPSPPSTSSTLNVVKRQTSNTATPLKVSAGRENKTRPLRKQNLKTNLNILEKEFISKLNLNEPDEDIELTIPLRKKETSVSEQNPEKCFRKVKCTSPEASVTPKTNTTSRVSSSTKKVNPLTRKGQKGFLESTPADRSSAARTTPRMGKSTNAFQTSSRSPESILNETEIFPISQRNTRTRRILSDKSTDSDDSMTGAFTRSPPKVKNLRRSHSFDGTVIKTRKAKSRTISVESTLAQSSMHDETVDSIIDETEIFKRKPKSQRILSDESTDSDPLTITDDSTGSIIILEETEGFTGKSKSIVTKSLPSTSLPIQNCGKSTNSCISSESTEISKKSDVCTTFDESIISDEFSIIDKTPSPAKQDGRIRHQYSDLINTPILCCNK